MAASGDIAKLVISGNFLNQLIQNVFFYRIEDVPTATWYEGLASTFVTSVLGPIRNVQSSGMNWTGISVVNLFNAAELHEAPLALIGSAADCGSSGNTPPFEAWGFKLIRSNALVRNGRKMIGGLCEGIVTQGAADAAIIPELTALATALAAELVAGGVDNFKPVIVKRIPYVTSEGKDAYRLPESAAEMGANWTYVKSAQYMRVTTMNSRKFGRGN